MTSSLEWPMPLGGSGLTEETQSAALPNGQPGRHHSCHPMASSQSGPGPPMPQVSCCTAWCFPLLWSQWMLVHKDPSFILLSVSQALHKDPHFPEGPAQGCTLHWLATLSHLTVPSFIRGC